MEKPQTGYSTDYSTGGRAFLPVQISAKVAASVASRNKQKTSA